MARKQETSANSEAWVKVDTMLTRDKKLAELGKAAGTALAVFKHALEKAALPATPEGKVARFSFKGIDVDGNGVKFAYCDAPKAKPATAPRGKGEVDPFASWATTPSGTLFRKAADGRKVRK
jgi:hypothetical protein